MIISQIIWIPDKIVQHSDPLKKNNVWIPDYLSSIQVMTWIMNHLANGLVWSIWSQHFTSNWIPLKLCNITTLITKYYYMNYVVSASIFLMALWFLIFRHFCFGDQTLPFNLLKMFSKFYPTISSRWCRPDSCRGIPQRKDRWPSDGHSQTCCRWSTGSSAPEPRTCTAAGSSCRGTACTWTIWHRRNRACPRRSEKWKSQDQVEIGSGLRKSIPSWVSILLLLKQWMHVTALLPSLDWLIS